MKRHEGHGHRNFATPFFVPGTIQGTASRMALLLAVLIGIPVNLLAEPKHEETLAQKLLRQYRQIESASCDVRRDVTTSEGSIRWLSRVHFRQSNQLHAANAAPLPRLIIADGTMMYQHQSGAERGFRRPIADLDINMRINLERVPGTLMDHLLRLEHVAETPLEASPDAPIRAAYAAEHVFAILEADEQLRLHRILFYDAGNHSQKTGEITSEGFVEVIPEVWVPMHHRATFYVGENTVRERIRISNFQANILIPDQKFTPAAHFADDIEWVDAFDLL